MSNPFGTRNHDPTLGIQAAIFNTSFRLGAGWGGGVAVGRASKIATNLSYCFKLPFPWFVICFVAVNLWLFSTILTKLILIVFPQFFCLFLERCTPGVTYSAIFTSQKHHFESNIFMETYKLLYSDRFVCLFVCFSTTRIKYHNILQLHVFVYKNLYCVPVLQKYLPNYSKRRVE